MLDSIVRLRTGSPSQIPLSFPTLTLMPKTLRRTPVYMSPEQLSQDNGNQGYLGSAVDVWASGVLLIVMLVREGRTSRQIRPGLALQA